MSDLPCDSEVWRAIDEYTNYQVSYQGRVRNVKTGRILVQIHRYRWLFRSQSL